ncbi:MAG: aldo/keto reductase, partial [Dehalococcoidales bacterium]|nr:aldo/keto reductase [Dehalococcoidales bacterium]
MRYRKLGRTGVDVGIVGLGAEHLEFASREVVTSVVDEALDGGVNYIDLFMASPGVRDNFGVVLKNKRHQVMIAGHLGAVLENGQCCKSRDKARCEKYFDDLLIRLQTDYLDTLMLHYVDDPDSYSKVFDSAGLLAVAVRLKEEGKARFIGMSGHNVQMALQAVNSGYIDVLMFPVNSAFDMLPGDMQVAALRQNDSYNRTGIAQDKALLERR